MEIKCKWCEHTLLYLEEEKRFVHANKYTKFLTNGNKHSHICRCKIGKNFCSCMKPELKEELEL